MQVRELDAASAADDELLALHALEEACGPPGAPFRTPELSLAHYRHGPAGAARRRWVVAEDGGELAGSAVLLIHGPAFVYVEILVRPEKRRRGIGSALLETVRGAAREEGIRSFFGHHWDEAGAAFAAHIGARDDQRDVRAVLDLAPRACRRLSSLRAGGCARGSAPPRTSWSSRSRLPATR